MSDLSEWFCKKCRCSERDCECDEPELVESVVNYIARGEQPPKDHPFFDKPC